MPAVRASTRCLGGVARRQLYVVCYNVGKTMAAKAQMPNYTTMVQHFLRTLQLPMAIYMLDYYLPMLNPNDGYNETGLTMQSAGPVLDEWQAIQLSYMFKGSEFGHWKASGGKDAFAFRHPSLEQAAVWQLLESEAHHHKVDPIGTHH